jgi:hypothetical protein
MNAPVNHNTVEDSLDRARDEIWRNAHVAIGYLKLVLGNVELADDTGTVLAFQQAAYHFAATKRHAGVLSAAWRERLGSSDGIDADERAFFQIADKLSAIWRMACDAGLRDDIGLVELHCHQAQSNTGGVRTRQKITLARGGRFLNRLPSLDDFDHWEEIPLPSAPPDVSSAKPPRAPLKATRFVYRDPATIPSRRFLYGRHFARGFVSVTAAPGGVGKSSLEIAEAIAIGTGRDLLGVEPWEIAPVWYMGLEDPLDEYERRVAAIALHFDVSGAEIEAALFLDSGRDQDFVIATEEKNGTKIVEPIVDAMVENVRRHGIGLIIVDPFVASHAVSENDNAKLEKVTRAWARIANEANCAVELVHHFRKGSGGGEPTADDVRGASAIVGAARSVRILAGMSQDQASEAGVKDRFRYFSVTFGKANLFLRSEALEWFHMASVSLGNGDGGPSDEIGVVTPWKWPNALDGLHVADLRKVQDAVSAGEWAESIQSKEWVGFAVAAVLNLDPEDKRDKARIKSLLRTWIKNDALRVEQGRDPGKRRLRPSVVVGNRA